ncbi:MAG TPA: tRNA pseudouridine(55) synthase TruB [Gemmatimonadales bacterium]|nr:tRNA pseudouridine(55) synthase TruB [Gemmatimonadales bacterium]
MCLVAKPRGPTSHDVVDIVRRALDQKRVGHLGTLDPFAEGLLVVVVGRATRLAPYAAGWKKSYDGVIRVGSVTTTDDLTGDVTATSEAWRELDLEQIRAASRGLLGEIEQMPPAYSAVKVDGVRAYKKARRGEAVTVGPRHVTVFELAVTGWSAPDVTFRATVSGGTYIRSLARDLGERLGSGGHLAELRRTAVGPFRLEDAVPAQAISPAHVRDPSLLVADLPSRALAGGERDAIVHGRPLAAAASEHGTIALMADGALLAVAEVVDGSIKPRLVLADA